MGSKTLVYIGLLLAIVLLICSDVAAKEQADINAAENKNVDATPNGVDDAKYGGNNGGYPGNGGGGSRNGGFSGGGSRGGRSRCYHSCCRWNYRRDECVRCCSYAGETVITEAKPHN
ncbi:hypothetical protein CsatB_020114 [Cannabis sativa]